MMSPLSISSRSRTSPGKLPRAPPTSFFKVPGYPVPLESAFYLPVLTMKITTGAAVLGMMASTQAFHVPIVARSRSALSMSAMPLSDAEVRL